MRLYLLIVSTNQPNKGVEFEDYELLPTTETYKSKDDFSRHAKKNGAKYADNEWLLLSELHDKRVIKLTETTQYGIFVTDSKTEKDTENKEQDKGE